jgi:hypothetical protein
VENVDDIDGSRRRKQDTWLVGVQEHNLPQGTTITRVRLRGEWTEGRHQEVMCTLSDSKLVRISRTNGADTFQYNAAEKHKIEMPTLDEAPADHSVDVPGLLTVFKAARKQRKFYDQGDCQVFAADVFRRLTGRKPGDLKQTGYTSDDDGF